MEEFTQIVEFLGYMSSLVYFVRFGLYLFSLDWFNTLSQNVIFRIA
jgi:hypothetical protein